MGMTQPLLTPTRCPVWMSWDSTSFLMVFQSRTWFHVTCDGSSVPQSSNGISKTDGFAQEFPPGWVSHTAGTISFPWPQWGQSNFPGDMVTQEKAHLAIPMTYLKIQQMQHFASPEAGGILMLSLCWKTACLQCLWTQIYKRSYLS